MTLRQDLATTIATFKAALNDIQVHEGVTYSQDREPEFTLVIKHIDAFQKVAEDLLPILEIIETSKRQLDDLHKEFKDIRAEFVDGIHLPSARIIIAGLLAVEQSRRTSNNASFPVYNQHEAQADGILLAVNHLKDALHL